MIHLEIRTDDKRKLITLTLVESNPPPDRKRWEFEVMTIAAIVKKFGPEFEQVVQEFGCNLATRCIEDMAAFMGKPGTKVQYMEIKPATPGNTGPIAAAGQPIFGGQPNGQATPSHPVPERGTGQAQRRAVPPADGGREGTEGICG